MSNKEKVHTINNQHTSLFFYNKTKIILPSTVFIISQTLLLSNLPSGEASIIFSEKDLSGRTRECEELKGQGCT